MRYGKVCLCHEHLSVRIQLRIEFASQTSASTSPQGEAFVSSNRAKKSAGRCVAVCPFTPYSSTASGPPSLTREGSCKSRFWAIDRHMAVTDATLDRRQLVAWTHGPYKFDIIFMFRQQTNARRYAFLHPTHPPQAVPLLSQEKANVSRAFGQQTNVRR